MCLPRSRARGPTGTDERPDECVCRRDRHTDARRHEHRQRSTRRHGRRVVRVGCQGGIYEPLATESREKCSGEADRRQRACKRRDRRPPNRLAKPCKATANQGGDALGVVIGSIRKREEHTGHGKQGEHHRAATKDGQTRFMKRGFLGSSTPRRPCSRNSAALWRSVAS